MVESPIRRVDHSLGVMRRFVLETLRAFASEAVTHQIVETALHAAREIEVPEEGERLQRFVERHLPDAVKKGLGAEVSAAVVEALRPVARMFPGEAETSRVRTRVQCGAAEGQMTSGLPEPDRKHPSLTWSASPPANAADPTADAGKSTASACGHAVDVRDDYPTATPPELALPMVILATCSEVREAGIQRWFGDRVALIVARDAVHMLESVELAMNLAPVLLIDCVFPSVRLPTLLMLGEDLPTGATVVLWGVPEEEIFDEFALSRGAARFIRCSAEADASDVGALLTPFITR